MWDIIVTTDPIVGPVPWGGVKILAIRVLVATVLLYFQSGLSAYRLCKLAQLFYFDPTLEVACMKRL
jgi:hypothetical protein